MAIKEEPQLRNEFIAQQKTERRKSVNKKEKNQREDSPQLKKVRKLIGLLLLVFSTFTIASMVSFLFSWQIDQDVIKSLDWNTVRAANPDMTSNFMGLMGAWISHLLLYRGFGLAGFFIPAFVFVLGLRLFFKVRIIHLRKSFSYSLVSLLFFSILLGFIADKINYFTGTSYDFFGGAVGLETEQWLSGMTGSLGVLLLLATVFVIVLITVFNVEFKIPAFFTGKKVVNNPLSSSLKNAGTGKDSTESKLESLFQLPTEGEEDQVVMNEDEEHSALEGIKLILKNESSTLNPPPSTPNPQEEVPFEIKPQAAAKPITSTEEEPINRSSWYKYPELSLLSEYKSDNAKINREELEVSKNLIVETLENYKIKIDKIEATIGPTVTLYEIIPAAGIRIARIKSLEDDIALSLAALGIRIIAPMPGKGTIGIEVPNGNPEIVGLKEALASPAFRHSTMDLPIALGKTISNEVFVTDLAKMPHLLMAGATGQGKSVGINTIIASILYKKHPEEVKFVLVDPKKVELSLFKNIEKHFLPQLPDGQEAIITDTRMVVDVLKSLCREMDERYDKLKDAQVRNLKEYNKKIERGLLDSDEHQRLPYIILVIDELADLMMTVGKEIELPIARLAQLARAIGIHLIVATQRPSVNIITGIIKANFPSRIAFRVTSRIDSRTILDSGGAEQLIGRGDMLYSTGNDIIRLQCPFIDTPEVEKITQYIQEQPYPEPFRLNIISEDENADIGEGYNDDLDAMFEDAARLIVATQQGSTSMLQRKLKLGYNRAGRLMDQLEKRRIVGPSEGSKAREVLFSDENALEQFLNDLLSKISK